MATPITERLASFFKKEGEQQEQVGTFFPYRYPLPHASERLKHSWYRSYDKWWKKRHKGLIARDRRMRRISNEEVAEMFRCNEITASYVEAILSHPFENFSENILRFKCRLNAYSLSVALAHPLLSRDKIGDTDEEARIEKLITSQTKLGMSEEEFDRAKTLAEGVISKRGPFYLP